MGEAVAKIDKAIKGEDYTPNTEDCEAAKQARGEL